MFQHIFVGRSVCNIAWMKGIIIKALGKHNEQLATKDLSLFNGPLFFTARTRCSVMIP